MTEFTRRDFLKAGAVGVGIAALDAFSPRTVEAQEETSVVEFPDTAEEFLNIVKVDRDALHKVEGYAVLRLEEIVPIRANANDVNSEIIGWQVTRERDSHTGEIPFFYMRNPWDKMQFGWMHNPEDRAVLGLTVDEANQLGYTADGNNDGIPDAVGAGIPGLYVGQVEGVSFYRDQSTQLGQLEKQTVQERSF